MTILILDDHTPDKGWAERLRALLAHHQLDSVPIASARDEAEARERLADPTCDIRFILLDLRPEAAYATLRRLQRDLGPLRPGLVLVVDDADASDAEMAAGFVEGGFIDHYLERGDDAALARLLLRYLRPADALLRDGGVASIGRAFERFLAARLPCWRRDASTILDRLAALAGEVSDGVLEMRTWTAARQRGVLPDLDAAWADHDTWRGLMRRVHPQLKPLRHDLAFTGRLRYWALPSPREGFKHRVLVFLDPAAIGDLTTAELHDLESRPQFRIDGDQWLPGSRFLFRLPLPAAAPGGRLPWLLGAWYDIGDGDWITLAQLRAQTLAREQPLRPELARVVQTIQRGENSPAMANVLGLHREGWGLMADSVLVNRAEQEGETIHNWQLVLLPLRLLGLHPDPTRPRPLPAAAFDRIIPQGLWLRGLAHWFAFGSIPDPLRPTSFDEGWDRLLRLLTPRTVHADPVPVAITDWWEEDGPTNRRGPASRQGARLRFPLANRCLGDNTTRPLVVEEPLTLTDCTLVCETPDDTTRPVFEQLRFRGPVELRDCRAVDENGHRAALVLRRCHFDAGLTLNGIDASEVVLEDCIFGKVEDGSSLHIVNVKPERQLRLVGVHSGGRIRVNNGSAARTFLKDVAAPEVHFEAWKTERLSVEPEKARGSWEFIRTEAADVYLTLPTGVSVNVARSTWGDTVVRAHPGTGTVAFRQHRGRSFVRVACEQPPSADVPPVEIVLDDAELAGELNVWGHLQVRLRDCELDRLVVDREPQWLTQLELREVRLAGGLDLGDTTVYGPVELRDVHIAGTLDLRKAHFHGPFHLNGGSLAEVCRGEGVHFHEPAEFHRLQSAGNVLFDAAHFHKDVAFRQAIVQGVLDLHAATFHRPPTFLDSTFERGVRLRGARWPVRAKRADAPCGSFRNCSVQGPFDPVEPRDLEGRPHRLFQLDLLGTTLPELQMDASAMKRSLEVKGEGDVQERVALARRLEAVLARDLLYDQADEFYRWAKNNEGGGSLGAWLNNLVWGHGTRPWRVWAWVLVLWGLLAGYVAWLAAALERPSLATVDGTLQLMGNIVFVETPDLKGLPAWAPWPPFLLVFCGAILMNLFFAALARRLLR